MAPSPGESHDRAAGVDDLVQADLDQGGYRIGCADGAAVAVIGDGYGMLRATASMAFIPWPNRAIASRFFSNSL